jgi:hypothetical protein
MANAMQPKTTVGFDNGMARLKPCPDAADSTTRGNCAVKGGRYAPVLFVRAEACLPAGGRSKHRPYGILVRQHAPEMIRRENQKSRRDAGATLREETLGEFLRNSRKASRESTLRRGRRTRRPQGLNSHFLFEVGVCDRMMAPTTVFNFQQICDFHPRLAKGCK